MSDNLQLTIFDSEPVIPPLTYYRAVSPANRTALQESVWRLVMSVTSGERCGESFASFAPRWVVAENVLGLLSSEHGRFFAGVLRDLSDLGYTVGWCVLSAAAVGALHRRERVAIVAHANRKPMEGLRCRNGFAFSRENDGFPSFRMPGITISERLPRFSPLVSEGNDQFIKPLITREDDGFPGAMDRNKALGNAVVPQCFYMVFRAIREAIELMGG